MKERISVFDIFGYLLLAVFLFSTHTKLFYWLDPSEQFIDGFMQMKIFSWQTFDEKSIQAMIYGALFGLMTVYIIAKRRGSKLYAIFIIVVAILDGMVVLWLYEIDFPPKYRMLFATIHYTIYTMFIILMFGFKSSENANTIAAKNIKKVAKRMQNNDIAIPDIEKRVITMLMDSNMNQSEIAKSLNLKPYQITRIKAKHGIG